MSAEEVLRVEWAKHYAGQVKNLVAITDGARNIRLRLWAVFGFYVTIILDWYHLKKRVNEIMSMMGLNKEVKKVHIKFILSFLWEGKTLDTIDYMNKEVNPSEYRAHKKVELIHYLDKHESEIIDYGRGKAAGKTIGSGRAESSVNQVIGLRQKNKGMSWTPRGSKALGILKSLEMNQQWDEYWTNAA